MPDKSDEKRYAVTINCIGAEIEGDTQTRIVGLNVDYPTLPYEGLVAVEAILADMVKNLSGLGIAQCKVKGLGKNLADLGIDIE